MQKDIFNDIKTLSEQHQAFDLSLESIEFPCPDMLALLANIYIKEGYNNYPPVEGIYSLRERISILIKKTRQINFDPEKEITVTSGIAQTVSAIISAFINEGDEVILFEPADIFYNPAIKLSGGSPVFVTLKQPDFHIDWEEVRKMISTKTRMIIINSPHNPTGKVLSEEDLLHLQKLTNGTNIIVVSTEHFEHLTYDNKQHKSVACFEKLLSKSFVISSLGAVFNINGWCISWCLAKEPLMSKFREVHQSQISSTITPLQYALSEFLKTYNNNFAEVTTFYQGKRNYFNRLMKDSPYTLLPSQGTYFQMIDFSNISDETDIEFAKRLITENNVAVMPISAFLTQKSKSKLLRICFAKENSTLEQAADLLIKNI
ncbi:Aspartate aminotransferase [hydrothermal vent metagenome]|uniref:Aspartate aminotransferase n=1 Tax=hydrothermal vent metagenome TaxID=652676 RepID=A0A3B0TCL0_9ZZZZ